MTVPPVMEDSPGSVLTTADESTRPGPLYRTRVVVLGPDRCGKTSLVQSLLQAAPSPQDYPTEGVSMHLWHPLRADGLQRLLNQKLTDGKQDMCVELWDTTGRQVCQAVHAIFLSTAAVCVIVYDVTDGGCVDKVLAVYSIIQQKGVTTPTIVVGTKTDRLNLASASEEGRLRERINQTLKQHDEARRQDLVKEAEDVRKQLREVKRPQEKEETNSSKRQTQPASDPGEAVLRQRLQTLEQCLAQARPSGRLLDVSLTTGKGFDDLRKVLLAVILETVENKVLPVTLRQSVITMYDQILTHRDSDSLVLPWEEFRNLVNKGDNSLNDDCTEELKYLEAMGVLLDCRVPAVRFPAAAPDRGRAPSLSHVCSNRYIVIHPAHFASAICLCLIDDDKKSFRFEAARFWPRDSGFKHPEPQLLSRVIECVPQQGLLRECLLPLLWQEYPLQQNQVLHMLHVMQSLGLLVPHGDQKKHCEGLAMPAFPSLSVRRCHALTLLNLLSDNRPQLNWTAKPFAGDMQVTWRITLLCAAHHGLLQRLLATVLQVGRDCCSYHHVWRTGVLLRVGEATVCAELPEDSRVEMSCRVNEPDVGLEKAAVSLLWVTLVPFLAHVHSFLGAWPGISIKVSLVALGQQFYHDNTVEREPELVVEQALMLWQRQQHLTFTDGGSERELDMTLLLPFKPTSTVTSARAWLDLVMTQAERVVKDAAGNSAVSEADISILSLAPPSSLVPRKGSSARGASKRPKKKSVEVKWRLEETDSSNNPVTKSGVSTAKPGGPTGGATANGAISATGVPASDTQRPGRVLSEEEEEAERVRVASGFVAAILASALADYVSMETGGDKHGATLLSAAQAAAARATAHAAQAAQTGNLEGAALAVIEAVKAVQVSAVGKSEVKLDASPFQSKVCVIL